MNKLFEYFWLFIIGSFFGFLVETIWCFIKNKKIESRKGLIYGPFTPIYGIAAVFITLILDIFNPKKKINVFIFTFVIYLIVEYTSSFLQEKIFGTKSWDYKNFPLNINGRVNFIYILIFSFLGLFWAKLYPKILMYTYIILNYFDLYNFISILLIIFVLYDIIISVIASYRQKLRRKGIKANNKIEFWLDKKYNDEYLKKIYANAIFVQE